MRTIENDFTAAIAALKIIASGLGKTRNGYHRRLARIEAITMARETCEALGIAYDKHAVAGMEPITQPREPITETDAGKLRAAIRRARNILHAHNRPDVPLPNEARLRARDILDLALEGSTAP